MIKMHSHLCDSDRYSITLLIRQMPESHKEHMQKTLEKHAEEFEERAKKSVSMDAYQNIMQCFYRLLKYSPWKASWPDILLAASHLDNNPIIGRQLKKSSLYLRETAATLYRHSRFEEAEHYLRLLSELEGTDSQQLCELGYCKERMGQYQQAITYFSQANLLEPDNELALYHLQLCNARLGRFEEQLHYLLKLEEKHPKDISLLTEVGLCLIHLKKWSEAQKRFFKLEVMGKRVIPSIRAIAWCALCKGDNDVAHRYYTRIIEEETRSAKWEDYLNMGHVEWLMGNIKEAINIYKEYVKRYVVANPEVKDALEPFMADSVLLQEKGISTTDLSLMHDIIERSLSASNQQ